MFSRATVAIRNHTCFAFSHASNDESGYQWEYLKLSVCIKAIFVLQNADDNNILFKESIIIKKKTTHQKTTKPKQKEQQV